MSVLLPELLSVTNVIALLQAALLILATGVSAFTTDNTDKGQGIVTGNDGTSTASGRSYSSARAGAVGFQR